MAVKTKDEIISQLNTLIGENASDDAIAILEDVSDTYDDFSTKLAESGDYKTKYEENDKKWRDKYRDRFMNGSSGDDDDFEDPEDKHEENKMTFDDLFVTK